MQSWCNSKNGHVPGETGQIESASWLHHHNNNRMVHAHSPKWSKNCPNRMEMMFFRPQVLAWKICWTYFDGIHFVTVIRISTPPKKLSRFLFQRIESFIMLTLTFHQIGWLGALKSVLESHILNLYVAWYSVIRVIFVSAKVFLTYKTPHLNKCTTTRSYNYFFLNDFES